MTLNLTLRLEKSDLPIYKDKIGVWVDSEFRNPLNITYLPEEFLTQDVLNAFMAAVERGFLLHQELIRKESEQSLNIWCPYKTKEKKKK